MIKKIKDLTLEEARAVCGTTVGGCTECPLNFNKKGYSTACYLDKLHCDKYTTNHQLNKKVEIDE